MPNESLTPDVRRLRVVGYATMREPSPTLEYGPFPSLTPTTTVVPLSTRIGAVTEVALSVERVVVQSREMVPPA